MLPFGHAGLTALAAQAADPEGDLKAPAAIALAPDLIDKPGSFLWAELVNGSTRAFGHSIAGALAALALLSAFRKDWKRVWILWGCYCGHFLLDRMWRQDNPVALFWPLLGPFPRQDAPGIPEGHFTLYNVCGEALGVLALLYVARRRGLLQIGGASRSRTCR